MSYILMNSNSGNFKISIETLSKELNMGKEKIGKILNNLIKEGYLQRQANFEGGLRNGFIYTIYNNISKN